MPAQHPPGRIRIFLRRAAGFPILLYRWLLSPLLPPSCIYSPSCSLYTYRAILRFGLPRGVCLGAARILRCSGLFTGGEDPIPREFSWQAVRRGYQTFRNPKKPKQGPDKE